MKEYTCAMCKQTFDCGWIDEEAKKEAKENFGSSPDEWVEGAELVCDDCYQEIHPSKYPNIVNQIKKDL